MKEEKLYYVERIFDSFPDGIIARNLTKEDATSLVLSQRNRYKVSYNIKEEKQNNE
jgi:hypothetical protein